MLYAVSPQTNDSQSDEHQTQILVGQGPDPRQEAIAAQPRHLGEVLDHLLRPGG